MGKSNKLTHKLTIELRKNLKQPLPLTVRHRHVPGTVHPPGGGAVSVRCYRATLGGTNGSIGMRALCVMHFIQFSILVCFLCSLYLLRILGFMQECPCEFRRVTRRSLSCMSCLYPLYFYTLFGVMTAVPEKGAYILGLRITIPAFLIT